VADADFFPRWRAKKFSRPSGLKIKVEARKSWPTTLNIQCPVSFNNKL